VVLPNNETDLERAALRLLQALKPDEWIQLDSDLHDHVLLPRGGLHAALMTSGDMTRHLTEPLLDDAISMLDRHLPIMDVAQILGSEFGLLPAEVDPNQSGLGLNKLSKEPTSFFSEQIRGYLDRASPLLADGSDKNRQAFLLAPATEIGRHMGDAVQKVMPDLKVVRVPGQSDLMFCSEQGCMSVQDLHKAMKQFRAAYESVAGAPPTSPHARFDIVDWLPLDP
jgi:hypothetical protein